jgi:hypothetical protein
VIVNSRLSFDTTHTVVLQGLYPSTVSTGPGSASYNTLNDHDIELTIWDLAGNSETIVVDPDVTTTTLIHDDIIANPIRRSVVGDLCLLNESTVQVGSTWTWSADLEVEIVAREESPPYAPLGDRVVVVQVLKQDSTTGLWEIVPLSDITHDAPATDFDLLIPLQPNDVVVTYSTHVQANGYGFPGDFLVLSPTAASGGSVGRTTLDISVADLDTSVTPVLLNIMAVIDAGEDYDENDPVFDDALFSLTTFINPATPTALRRIEKGDGCP